MSLNPSASAPQWLTLVFLAAILSMATRCTGPSPTEISRDRAVEIARAQVSFQPDSVEAQRTTSGVRQVWRITFRGRLAGQPPELFETVIIEVDRRSGEIVSVART